MWSGPVRVLYPRKLSKEAEGRRQTSLRGSRAASLSRSVGGALDPPVLLVRRSAASWGHTPAFTRPHSPLQGTRARAAVIVATVPRNNTPDFCIPRKTRSVTVSTALCVTACHSSASGQACSTASQGCRGPEWSRQGPRPRAGCGGEGASGRAH